MKRKIIGAALCCMALLGACHRGETPEENSSEASSPKVSVFESQPETSSSPASDVYSSADDTAPPMEYESLSLGQYQRKLQQRGISVTGTDLVINDDNTFSFRLLLENKSSSNALPVTGTFADDEYDTFVAATWGGLSVLDDDTLVVYTRGQIHFLSLSTLETKVPSPELTDYKDCWVLGVGNTGDGYIAALGGSDLSRIVYLDASGNITKTVDADNPSSFRDRDIDYFTRKDRYTVGLVFNVFPVMGTIQFDAPNREMVLLNQYAHSSWAAYEGNDAGHLDYYLLFDPATGTLIDASEEFNHVDEDKRYALLHYTSNNSNDHTGYIGMYYENDVRKAVIAFAGPPNYFTFGDEGIDWTVKGNQVQIVNSHGCQYITLDFDKMTGSAEYRFTQENLANDVLAASPGGRYSLQAVNMSGAGDGYWGQVVLADSEIGNIQYVCNMPVRYGGDAASTNFSDDSHFTTADGQTLRIYAVNTPDQYRTVELYLPWDDSNVIYCNSIYDIRNDRYLLTYLDEVGVNRGGWHDYETAVYHVAVFDNALQVVKDVIVPELEVTHSIYAMPCPTMVWDGTLFTLGGIPVDLGLSIQS